VIYAEVLSEISEGSPALVDWMVDRMLLLMVTGRLLAIDALCPPPSLLAQGIGCC